MFFYGIIYKFVLFLLEIVMSEEKQMTNSIIPGGWPLGHRIYNHLYRGINFPLGILIEFILVLSKLLAIALLIYKP